ASSSSQAQLNNFIKRNKIGLLRMGGIIMIKRTSLMSIVFIMSVILISGVFAATNSSWKKMGDRSNDILLNVAGSPVNISIDQNGSVLPVLDPTRDPVYITQTDD